MTLRQMAYLSIQPEAMAKSRAFVKHFMPWITSTVIVTPPRLKEQMQALGDDVVVITDDEVLPPGTDPSQLDHQTLNFRLRVGMCLSGVTDDLFVMSDDDYRPIKHITPDFFVETDETGHERLIGYSFYNLQDWVYEVSAFDAGQHNTLQVMAYLGAEQRSYASHQPQAIDRRIFIECAGVMERVAPGVAVDEWAVHYNLGRKLHPDRFADTRPYEVLGWPEYPNLWRRQVVPRTYSFENFYPNLYRPGYLYQGLSTTFVDELTTEREAVEKLRRWRKLDMQTRRLETDVGVHYPWRESAKRYEQLRKAKRQLDHVLMGYRANRRVDPFD